MKGKTYEEWTKDPRYKKLNKHGKLILHLLTHHRTKKVRARSSVSAITNYGKRAW